MSQSGGVLTGDSNPKLAALREAGRRVLSTRYRRQSAYCGGSDRVPDGVDVQAARRWLTEALALAKRAWGPGSEVAARLAARLERDLSAEEVEGALEDLERRADL